MQKIVKYSILMDWDSSRLADSVNGMIAEGWQPFGNAVPVGEKWVWQPMVKYEDATPSNKEGQKL